MTEVETSNATDLAILAFDAIKSIFNTVIPTIHTSRDEYADEQGDLTKQMSLIANMAVCDHYRTMLWNSSRYPEDVQNVMWGDKNIIELIASIASCLPQDGVASWKTGAAKWLSRNEKLVVSCALDHSKLIETPKWRIDFEIASGFRANTEITLESPAAEIYGGAL